MVSKPSKIFYGDDGEPISPELIANFNQVKASEKPWDPQEMIPIDMQPTNSASQVAAQVADRTATTLWNSPTIRESSIGHAATTVEETLKQEVVLGDSRPQSIQHKFNFNVQAFQTLAQIQYSGFTNAAIRYKITESKFAFELFEKITGNKDLVVSHTIGREDRLSAMSVRWTF